MLFLAFLFAVFVDDADVLVKLEESIAHGGKANDLLRQFGSSS
jgi:hypothetical protein